MGILDVLGFGNSKPEPQTIVLQQPEPVKEQAPEPAPLTTQADWFKPAETDAKPVEFDPSKLFTADPEQLNKAIGELNFVQSGLTPEVMEQIQAGGEGAAQATMKLMNSVAQQTMHASMQASSKMIETALAKAAPAFQAKIGEQTRSERIESAIKESSPIFQGPAASFMVDALKERFATKFPTATTEEWKQMAAGFAADLVKLGTPKQEESASAVPATDWSKFLGD